MPFNTQYTAAKDNLLLVRIGIASVTAALAINREAQNAFSLREWTARGTLAYEILRNPEPWTQIMAYSVVSQDPTITNASSDALILATINAVWSKLAINLNVAP